ncbi:RES family NAD+ phosphorylase [Sinorhizobium meliloti]|uniref:RES family NAD+ phosphorylase n=1 Tax=Rhizobium meliloti TaxID=382 RepID=UPI003076E7E4
MNGRIKPPPGFENSPLDIETVRAGRRFGRIYASAFPDPLGYGKTPSRFSDPRRRDPARRFGVVYLGDTLKVCFLEAVLWKEIYARRYAEIETIADLRLVDLREDTRSGWECRRMSQNPPANPSGGRGRLLSMSTGPCRTASSILPA